MPKQRPSRCDIATEHCRDICDRAANSLTLLSDDAALSMLEDMPAEHSFVCPQAEKSSTSFNHQETSQPFPENHTYRGKFMQGKEKEYAATLETYEAMYSSPSNNHLLGIRQCRSYAKFKREKNTGEVKVFGDSCRDRWCPMCAGQKAHYAKDSTKEYIGSMTEPRLLTLTLRNDGNDLKSQIEFLQSCFRRLRQRAYWKRNVRGGIWYLQCKRGENSGFWHPHLHIVIDGKWMEQARLSALWELVTFGSPVIDIRRISDVDHTASYVARYCSRPAKLSDMPLADRIEIVESLFGKRLSGTFGNGKIVTLTPPKIEDTGEWSDVGFFDKVVRDAKTKPFAKEVLKSYYNEEPLSETAFEAYTGKPVNVVIGDYKHPEEPQLYLDFY